MAGHGNDKAAVDPLSVAGQPLDEAVAEQAAQWLTLLMCEDVSEEDRRLWRRWRDAHPDHDRAWRHIEAVTGRLDALAPSSAYQVLSPYAGAGERRLEERREDGPPWPAPADRLPSED